MTFVKRVYIKETVHHHKYSVKGRKTAHFFIKLSVVSLVVYMLILFGMPALLKTIVRQEEASVAGVSDQKSLMASANGLSSIEPTVTISHLQEIVAQHLQESTGKYGVVVKNLKTGEQFAFNDHTKFQSASLYKLWVMVSVFDVIKKGKLSMDSILSKDAKDLNEANQIASEEASIQEGTLTMSVSDALEKMITRSDNYATYLLIDRVGFAGVKQFIKEHGLNDSSIAQPPTTSAADVARFYEDLYHGKLADLETTEQMLGLLKQQQLNSKLPKYLPEDLVIAHKTGELNAFSHDAGIVYSQHGDYIIVILTQSSYPPDAVESIAAISRDIYAYFEG